MKHRRSIPKAGHSVLYVRASAETTSALDALAAARARGTGRPWKRAEIVRALIADAYSQLPRLA